MLFSAKHPFFKAFYTYMLKPILCHQECKEALACKE